MMSTVTAIDASVAGARNNNLVAESDYNAAITALQCKINDKKVSNHTKNDDPVLYQLLSDCSNSITNQIQKVVQPISDEAYHMYLSRYKENYISYPDDFITSTKHNTDIKSSVSIKSMKEIDDIEEEFTHDELIDHTAIVRVQELRQQVRDKANNIIQLRNETIQRAVSITERQVSLLRQKELFESSATKNMNQDSSHQGTKMSLLLEQHQTVLNEMKDSLMKLQDEYNISNNDTSNENENNNNIVGSVLPIMNLQKTFYNTIHNIESSLYEQQQQQNHGTASSQIEQAIYRRDYLPSQHYNNNADGEATNNDDTIEMMSTETIDPEQILSHLLCHY